MPIRLGDGHFFGTLCAIDPEPRPLSRRQAELLVVLACLVATRIERDRELAARHQAEEVLRAREERYRAVADQLAEGILLFESDSKRVLESNPAFRQLVGYNAAELADLTLYDLSTAGPGEIDEQVRQATERRLCWPFTPSDPVFEQSCLYREVCPCGTTQCPHRRDGGLC